MMNDVCLYHLELGPHVPVPGLLRLHIILLCSLPQSGLLGAYAYNACMCALPADLISHPQHFMDARQNAASYLYIY
jgi:hypothetical protein